MSIGVVLIGIGAVAVVVAYVARPFRTATGRTSLDRVIERWVARVRDEGVVSEGTQGAGELGEGMGAEASTINFCPQCGRQVAADDRFCSRCGTRLREGAA